MLVQLNIRIVCTGCFISKWIEPLQRVSISSCSFIGINFHKIVLPRKKSENWHPMYVSNRLYGIYIHRYACVCLQPLM